jgi:hypothetical protein
VLRATRQIAAEIRRYCATHPDARDTVAGITWWVQIQLQHDISSHVADAVELLVKQGILERYVLQDGSEVFGSVQSAHEDGMDRGD